VCEPSSVIQITLASPLILLSSHISFRFQVTLILPECILGSLLLSCALVRLEYIKWYQSLGYPLVAKASKPQTQSLAKHKPTHKEPSYNMSSSLTPTQVAEKALREKAELKAQVKYQQSRLSQML